MAGREEKSEAAKVRANRRAGQKLRRLLERERELWDEGRLRIAGVDEAGMGPLAGPVVAAAVIFRPGHGLRGVNDSKKLSEIRRIELADEIRREAVAWTVIEIEPEEIDRINIFRAGLEAMRRAVEALAPAPDYLLVDGRNPVPRALLPQEQVIGGDARCHAIAAASILAKTARDDRMQRLDREFPGYGFAGHKGYPTAAHRDAIRRLGPCPVHRRSFTLLPQPGLWD